MLPFQEQLPTPFPTSTLPTLPTELTPAPVLPPAPATDGTGSTNLAAMLALLIYLAFFGAMGYRRGVQRELTVFAVALLFSLFLQRFSDAVVTFFDRFGKGLAFLTGQPIPEQSGLGVWAAANTPTLLTLLWLGAVVLAYLLSDRFVKKTKGDGWAVLVGVLNGLIFASIFAPLLTALIFPDVPIQGPVIQLPIFGFLGNIWQQVSELLVRTWGALQPVASNVLFIGVVLLVLLAALTLRTNTKPKS